MALGLAVAGYASSSADADPNERTFEYSPGALFHLRTSTTVSQVVTFVEGERVESVELSDPDAYHVTMSAGAVGVALRAIKSNALALMTVRTDRRSYQLELVSAGDQAVSEAVRFLPGVLPQPSAGAAPAGSLTTPQASRYRLSGDDTVRPTAIRDDGRKMYLSWADNQPLPAVFAIGPSGREEIVDGYVRNGLFTIDRLYQTLVFRIDGHSAKARRSKREER